MSLPNYMGCLMQFYKSLSLYYTEMCFKILNYFQRKSVFLPRNLLFTNHVVRYVLLRPLRLELDSRPSSAKYSNSSTKL
jgi:hypothetical protein